MVYDAADPKLEDKKSFCPEKGKALTFDSNFVHASSDIRFMQVTFEARTFPWEQSNGVLSKALHCIQKNKYNQEHLRAWMLI